MALIVVALAVTASALLIFYPERTEVQYGGAASAVSLVIPTSTNIAPEDSDNRRVESRPAQGAPASALSRPEPRMKGAATLREPLDELLRRAARSIDPEERSQATDAVVACFLAKRREGQKLDPEWVAPGNPMLAQRLIEDVKTASARIAKYCAEGSVEDPHSYSRRNINTQDSLAIRVRERSSKAAARIEHDQAVIQMLSNPVRYFVALDKWLRYPGPAKQAVPALQALERQQLRFVLNRLYERLSGQRMEPDSFRALIQCLSDPEACPSAPPLGEAELLQAVQVADHVERLIREQRWAELLG